MAPISKASTKPKGATKQKGASKQNGVTKSKGATKPKGAAKQKGAPNPKLTKAQAATNNAPQPFPPTTSTTMPTTGLPNGDSQSQNPAPMIGGWGLRRRQINISYAPKAPIRQTRYPTTKKASAVRGTGGVIHFRTTATAAQPTTAITNTANPAATTSTAAHTGAPTFKFFTSTAQKNGSLLRDGDYTVISSRNRTTGADTSNGGPTLFQRGWAAQYHDPDSGWQYGALDKYLDAFHQRHSKYLKPVLQQIESGYSVSKFSLLPRGRWEPSLFYDWQLCRVLESAEATNDATTDIWQGALRQSLTLETWKSLLQPTGHLTGTVITELTSLLCHFANHGIAKPQGRTTFMLDPYLTLQLIQPVENIAAQTTPAALLSIPSAPISLEDKCNFLLVPVCYDEHWLCVILDFPRRRLLCLDSIPNKSRTTFLGGRISNWLSSQLRTPSDATTAWQYYSLPAVRQGNGDDCGVWTILNMLCIILDINPLSLQEDEDLHRIPMIRYLLGTTIIQRGWTWENVLRNTTLGSSVYPRQFIETGFQGTIE